MPLRLSLLAKERLAAINDAEKKRNVMPTLSGFVQNSWAVLEPSTPLEWNWHLDAMCDHLQETLYDWIAGQKDPEFVPRIQNLLMNVPPGSGKSRVFSVCMPAWMWLLYPSWRALFITSNPRVAMRDALFCRDLIESDWYQLTYKPAWKLRADQSAKSSFWNTAGGQRQAFGFTSRITGDRVDFLGVDDPHDAEEVLSETMRLSVIDRWDSAIGNRVNDLRRSVRAGIMQRLHAGDWAAHVLKQGWAHLCIPQEFEEGRPPTALGWVDPRTEPGELMFPKRFTPEVLAQEKIRLGAYGYAGQHQQRPTPAGGGIVQLAWFNRYDTLPARPEKVVISVDTAQTAKETSAYWAIGVYLIYRGEYFIAEVYRRQMVFPVGQRAVISICEKYRDLGYIPDEVLIENKSNGIDLINNLKSNPDFPWPLIPIDPEADKITRMESQAGAVEAGKCFLPSSAGWLPDFELEVEQFPLGFKDQIDQFSQFLKRMKLGETRHWASLYQTHQPPQVDEYGEVDMDLLFRR